MTSTNQVTLINKLLWDDEYLKAFASQVLESGAANYQGQCLQFWHEDDDGNLTYSKHQLISKFFAALGIRSLVLGSDTSGMATALPVFIRGNRCEEINGDILRSITYKIIDFMIDAVGGADEELEQVRTLLGFSKEIFEKKGLRTMPDLYDKEIFSDNATSAFRFFANGWIEITKEGVSELRSYEELPPNKLIWNSSVIAREYDSASTGDETHFSDFLENLTRDDEGNACPKMLKNIKLGVGYLCHRHNFAHQRKWVSVVDKHFDPTRKKAEGGNGKSILIGALRNVMNVCDLDGKEFKKGKSDTFAFADVTPATEVVFFDDADEKFDDKRLYSRTTGNFHIRRMRQNPFSIKAQEAPKIAITSNYPIGDNDFSSVRRQFLIEVTDFYKTQTEMYGLTPFELHGNKAIAVEGGGWSSSDWNAFYKVIWDCIALYLNEGLPSASVESDAFKRSRLISAFGYDCAEDVLDFFIAKLNTDVGVDECFVEVLYKETRDKVTTLDPDIKNSELWEFFKKVGSAYQMLPNSKSGGRLKQARLSGKRQQAWIDAGMAEFINVNGEKTLEQDDPKVYVYQVASFKRPESVFSLSRPNFDDKKEEVIETPITELF